MFPELTEGMKIDLQKLGMVCKCYENTEKCLVSRIHLLCQEALSDKMMDVKVSLECDDKVLNREMLEVRVALTASFGDDDTTCAYMEDIMKICRALGNTNPRIHAEDNILVLYFSCYALAKSLNGDMSVWEDTENETETETDNNVSLNSQKTTLMNESTVNISQEEIMKFHRNFMKFQRENPNNFSYWFPHVRHLADKGVSIPESVIIPVPEEVYKTFCQERQEGAERIRQWVKKEVAPAIAANERLRGHKVFVRNGYYSHKLDFANGCVVADATDEGNLTRIITNLQTQALMKETDGYFELVAREYIEPENGTPTIFNGLPLRPELRLFYAFDKHRVLYAANYWNWNYCHDAICYDSFGNSLPDRNTYEERWPFLKYMTKHLLTKHLPMIADALASVDTLTMPDGQPNIWSVDFMLEEDRVWLIDMSPAWRSPYWDAKRGKELYHSEKYVAPVV